MSRGRLKLMLKSALVVVGGLLVSLVLWLAGRRSGQKTAVQIPLDPTAKDNAAMHDAISTIVEKGKISAVAGEKQKEIDTIMKLPDPKDKLVQLANALKDL